MRVGRASSLETGGLPDRAVMRGGLRPLPGSWCGRALRPLAGLENVDLVFLTAVIAIAVRFGLGPSLTAAIASVLAYNFFFIHPAFTFEVADPKNVAALVFFLVFAITSNLAARVRVQRSPPRSRLDPRRRSTASAAASRALSTVANSRAPQPRA